MLLKVVVLAACAVLAAASPQADRLEELMRSANISSRYSDNVFEDARLDVPDLVRKYRYPLEVHHVTTDDGYILEMHRIPHGRDNHNTPDSNKPVVFVMHGLLSSSADWVLLGPGCGLAYILAEEGFDVWLGNARGTYYSRNHLTLRPDALLNTQFWEFSWDEIGFYDLPAMIDRALLVTGKSKLHYIGHSQGTTSFFVFASLRPEYNNKIISMHAMAPVAYMEYNQNLLLKFISPFSKNIEKLMSLFGKGEFLPNSQIMTWAGHAMCVDEVSLQVLCSNIVFLFGGFSESQHNATMIPVKFGHTPAGASVRQFAHYGQGIADKRFRRYDHGLIANRRKYGSITPPNYPLNRITAPVFLHYAQADHFAHVRDVDRLFAELGRPIGKFLIPLPTFSHVDFMWGIDAKTLVFDRIINHIWAMEATL